MTEPVAEMTKELDVEVVTPTLEQECLSAGRITQANIALGTV